MGATKGEAEIVGGVEVSKDLLCGGPVGLTWVDGVLAEFAKGKDDIRTGVKSCEM